MIISSVTMPPLPAPNLRTAGNWRVHAGTWVRPWEWSRPELYAACHADTLAIPPGPLTADPVTCDNCRKRISRSPRLEPAGPIPVIAYEAWMAEWSFAVATARSLAPDRNTWLPTVLRGEMESYRRVTDLEQSIVDLVRDHRDVDLPIARWFITESYLAIQQIFHNADTGLHAA